MCKIKEYIFIILSFVAGCIITIIITSNSTSKIIYEKNSISKSVKKVFDTVVTVEPLINDETDGNGTGFIYKTDNKYGYIFTNEHVISSHEEANITLSDGKIVKGEILGNDKYLDLAVIRIDKKYVKKVAKLGSSEKTNIGDLVFSLGTPIDKRYEGTVTQGILSGKNRIVDTNVDDKDWLMDLIQVDASINPGNSGGPIFNINGEVIGITTIKYIDDKIDGMGFAIPIEYALKQMDKLEKNEKIEWPSLGITSIDAENSSALAKENIEIPNDIYEGVVIKEIEDNGSVSNKLKKGDLITKIDDYSIKNKTYLRYKLYKYKIGDTITITYIRNKKEYKTKVTLK